MSSRIIALIFEVYVGALSGVKRIVAKLDNPRLLKITFHTLRRWEGTMLYRQTRDILFVMRFLATKHQKYNGICSPC